MRISVCASRLKLSADKGWSGFARLRGVVPRFSNADTASGAIFLFPAAPKARRVWWKDGIVPVGQRISLFFFKCQHFFMIRRGRPYSARNSQHYWIIARGVIPAGDYGTGTVLTFNLK